jgi:hypothetical protein
MANVAITKTAIPNCTHASVEKVIVLNIRYQDIINNGTAFAADDTASFSIPIAAGEAVVAASAKLITAFDDSGTGDQLNMVVGDGTDVDGFLATAALHTTQTEITTVYGTGDLVDGTTSNYKWYETAGSVVIALDGTAGAAIDFDLFTAGEVEVKVWIKEA